MKTLELNQIGQIAVTVNDVDRAVTFYRDVLGMSLLFQMPEMAFFVCGGVRLMLATPQGESGGTSLIYYQVADIQAAHEQLLAHNATIVRAPQLTAKMPDHELWQCFFRDPDGNLLALMSEVRT
ncbi:MAG TPA: VOC family protein [Bacteroidetes bacterium]|nr:VOC family protein [Bacteroidota bacterium]